MTQCNIAPTNHHPTDTMIEHFVDDIRPTLQKWLCAGHKVALLTLVNVEGSSPRKIGSQMLVNEKGEFVGLLSGGCVEAALVLEAQNCLTSKKWQLIRYGRESDFFDIQLPCGSGIDVLIVPLNASNIDAKEVSKLANSVHNRSPITVKYDLQTHTLSCLGLETPSATMSTETTDFASNLPLQSNRVSVESELTCFTRTYTPRHQLMVFGDGAVFDCFKMLAQTFDFDLRFLSVSQYQQARVLDQWSSLVLLSHDHDWDIKILKQALPTEVPYIAALGSRKTHAQRLELLEFEGISEKDRQRVKGPAGINIGGNTPPEIALSVLAEVIAFRNQQLSV